MSNLVKVGKKALTAAVSFTTIMWSVGVASLPVAAKAALPAAPALIKGSLPAVYYYATDGKRYVFPSEKDYYTWYTDFSSVVTVSDADLASRPLGGNVTHREATRMVKIQSDPKTYWVGPSGVLHWVKSEAEAVKIAGPFWNTQIDDVSDAFFVNYHAGADLDTDVMTDGTLFTTGVGSSTYVLWGGKAWTVSAAGMVANMFQGRFVRSRTDFSVNPASVFVNGGTLNDNSYWMANSPSSAANFGNPNPSPTPTPGPQPTGSVSVTGLAATNLTVTNNASNVGLLGVTFTGSGTITSLTLHRVGPGAAADWSNVYIYNGPTRITTGRTVNTSTNDAVFGNLSLAVNGSLTIWFTGDLISTGANASDQHIFQLLGATSIQGVTASGNFPISGGTITVSGQASGTITLSSTSTPGNPNVGQLGAVLARVRLTEGSAEDGRLKQITFSQDGSVQTSELKNLAVWVGATDIMNCSVTGQKAVCLSVDPAGWFMGKGTNAEAELHGDLTGSIRPGTDTIRFYVDFTTDVQKLGQSFGFDEAVIDNFTSAQATTITVQGGTLTVAFNGPSATTLSTGTNDALLLKETITAQQQVLWRNKRIKITTTGIAGFESEVTDCKVSEWNTDGTVSNIWWGPKDLANFTNLGGGVYTAVYTEEVTVNPGSHIVGFSCDLQANANLNGATVRVTEQQVVDGDIKDAFGNTFPASAIVPQSDIVGNQMTIGAGQLTIGMASSPEGATITRNGQACFGFVFTAGTSTPVTVTRIVFRGYVSVDGNANTYATSETDSTAAARTIRDFVLSGTLTDGTSSGTAIGSPKSPDTNNNFTFDNFRWNLAAGESRTGVLCLTISGNPPFGTNTNEIYVDVEGTGGNNTTSNISAESTTDGNAITATSTQYNIENAAKDIHLNDNNLADNTANFPLIVYTIQQSGILIKEVDASTPLAGILVAGTSNNSIINIKFTALNEDFKLTRDTFAVGNAAQSADDVVSASLFKGSTLIATSSLDSNGRVTFADETNGLVVIPAGGSVIVSVKLNMAEDLSGTSGSDTGDVVTFNENINGTDAIEEFTAVGNASSTRLCDLVTLCPQRFYDTDAGGVPTSNLRFNDNDSPAVDNTPPGGPQPILFTSASWTVRKERPLVVKSTSGLSSVAINGDQSIAGISVTAKSNSGTPGAASVSAATVGSSLAIKQWVFDLSRAGSGNETAGSFKFFEDGNDITNDVTILDQTGADVKGSNGTFNAANAMKVTVRETGSLVRQVGDGTSKNYYLKATLSGLTTGESITTTLNVDSKQPSNLAEPARAAMRSNALCMTSDGAGGADQIFIDLNGDGAFTAGVDVQMKNVNQGFPVGTRCDLNQYDIHEDAGNLVFLDVDGSGGPYGGVGADILLDTDANAVGAGVFVGQDLKVNFTGSGAVDTVFLDLNNNNVLDATDVAVNNDNNQGALDTAATVITEAQFTHFDWSDTSADASSDLTNDWTNGFNVFTSNISHTVSL